jgi:hypothetical protein
LGSRIHFDGVTDTDELARLEAAIARVVGLGLPDGWEQLELDFTQLIRPIQSVTYPAAVVIQTAALVL